MSPALTISSGLVVALPAGTDTLRRSSALRAGFQPRLDELTSAPMKFALAHSIRIVANAVRLNATAQIPRVRRRSRSSLMDGSTPNGLGCRVPTPSEHLDTTLGRSRGGIPSPICVELCVAGHVGRNEVGSSQAFLVVITRPAPFGAWNARLPETKLTRPTRAGGSSRASAGKTATKVITKKWVSARVIRLSERRPAADRTFHKGWLSHLLQGGIKLTQRGGICSAGRNRRSTGNRRDRSEHQIAEKGFWTPPIFLYVS